MSLKDAFSGFGEVTEGELQLHFITQMLLNAEQSAFGC